MEGKVSMLLGLVRVSSYGGLFAAMQFQRFRLLGEKAAHRRSLVAPLRVLWDGHSRLALQSHSEVW